MNFKKLETLGGIGSILTGLICTWIGYTDYMEGQSWPIWAVMTVVLVVNGILMMLHKRLPPALVPRKPAQPITSPRIPS